jgi:hypothetical protein
VTKAQVGLGSVDNTSDTSKPVRTATQTALNAKQNTIAAGTSGNYLLQSGAAGTVSARARNLVQEKKIVNDWGWNSATYGKWAKILSGASSASWTQSARIQFWGGNDSESDWFDIQLVFNRSRRVIFGEVSTYSIIDQYLAFRVSNNQFEVYFKMPAAGRDMQIQVSDISSGWSQWIAEWENVAAALTLNPLTDNLFTPVQIVTANPLAVQNTSVSPASADVNITYPSQITRNAALVYLTVQINGGGIGVYELFRGGSSLGSLVRTIVALSNVTVTGAYQSCRIVSTSANIINYSLSFIKLR